MIADTTNPLYVVAQSTAHEDENVRKEAFAQAHELCLTGKQLFEFVAHMVKVRGWGKNARNFVADWYNRRPVEELAEQMLKYRKYMGWSHRDLLRMGKPVPPTFEHQALYAWAVDKPVEHYDKLPKLVVLYEAVRCRTYDTAPDRYRKAILRDDRFTWGMLPSEWLFHPEVWEKLAERMPLEEVLTNLGRMTQVGLTSALKLTLIKRIEQGGHVTPEQVWHAMEVYASGHGLHTSSAWKPSERILAALRVLYDRMLVE